MNWWAIGECPFGGGKPIHSRVLPLEADAAASESAFVAFLQIFCESDSVQGDVFQMFCEALFDIPKLLGAERNGFVTDAGGGEE